MTKKEILDAVKGLNAREHARYLRSIGKRVPPKKDEPPMTLAEVEEYCAEVRARHDKIMGRR